MKYSSAVIAVANIAISRKFYEELFCLQVFQDYGRNVAYTCGLALQQDFDWLVGIPKSKMVTRPHDMELCFEETDFDLFVKKLKEYPNIEYLSDVIEHSWGQRVIRFYDPDGHIVEVGEDMKAVVNRFLATGMTMEEVSVRMDVSTGDLERLLNN